MHGQTFVHYLHTIFGTYAAKISLFVFVICYPFIIFLTTLRDLGDFLANSFLTITPIEAVLVMMLLPVYFVLRSGLNTIGRVAEVLFFIVILLFCTGYFPLLPKVDWFNIKPIYEFGWKPIAAGSFILFSFPYFENIFILFIIESIS